MKIAGDTGELHGQKDGKEGRDEIFHVERQHRPLLLATAATDRDAVASLEGGGVDRVPLLWDKERSIINELSQRAVSCGGSVIVHVTLEGEFTLNSIKL